MRRKLTGATNSNIKNIFKTLIVEFHDSTLPRIIERPIEIPLLTEKITSIIGPRRSGKTYLMMQQIKKLLLHVPKQQIVYINFEDERLNITAQDLGLLLDAYVELYPEISLNKVYFFFDEIQNIEGWERFIRRLYDFKTKHIFITGSNSKLLSTEIATALRGRTLRYEVFPLSFQEFLQFKKVTMTNRDLLKQQAKAKIKALFNEYLLYGGFPEIVLSNDTTIKLKILQEYADVMIFRDIVERYEVKNIPVLRYFIKRVVESIGKPLSINKIYNELKSQGYKLAKDTLYAYLDYLQAVYFVLLVQKYAKSIVKSELSLKKAYLIDNGLVNALTFSFKENLGALLENLLAREFYRQGYNLFYFKYNNGQELECDFILEKQGSLVPVQVSFSLKDNNTLNREVSGLLKAMSFVGAKKGLIITFEEEDTIKDGNNVIEVVPAYKYLLNNEEYL